MGTCHCELRSTQHYHCVDSQVSSSPQSLSLSPELLWLVATMLPNSLFFDSLAVLALGCHVQLHRCEVNPLTLEFELPSNNMQLMMSELAPVNLRGGLVEIHGISFQIGYVSSGWIGFGVFFWPDNGNNWRLPVAITCLWPLLLLCGLPFCPESPR